MATEDKIRIASFAITTTGNRNLTISGFGTPTAAIMIMSRGSNNTAGGGGLSIGFTDGTNSFAFGCRERDGTNKVESDSRIVLGVANRLSEMPGLSANANNQRNVNNFVGFITDGIEISVPEFTSPCHVTIILIQCANAEVGSFDTSATQDVATTITMSPAFPPQTVFILGSNDNSSWSVNWDSTLGIADFNGSTISQGALDWGSFNNSTEGDPVAHISDTRVKNNRLTGADIAIELTNFLSSSFDAVTRDAATASVDIAFLALEWNGANRTVAVFDSPTGTATIDKSFTWPGFKPQFVLQGLSAIQVVGTEELDADAGPAGIGGFDKDGGEECVAWATEDNAATINSESTHENEALILHDDVGAGLFAANFANGSMDANGYTLEFTTIPSSTTRKWLGFALGEEGGAQVWPSPTKQMAHLLLR